ncbi:kinesin light chain 3 [Triangularia verruculosa]|uniref:Kinesin light chain 3 n=1 Tax=Triangularia verruculosa TaxID=2587418 RepID=A0AAN7ARZ7_9PEZI|nr:kinesin light chain 3 [Triangularia verruculosa]
MAQVWNWQSHTPPDIRSGFKIAIFCALPTEADAVHALFDYHWDDNGPPYDKVAGDPNAYSTGAIGCHNVVLAHMSSIGKVSSALVAANFKQSFPNIELALVVGTCGVVPFGPKKEERLLGDVIISDGVVQYDLGRQLPEGFRRKDTLLDSLGRPNLEIRSLLAKLKVLHHRKALRTRMTAYLNTLQAEPELAAGYPGKAKDRLFEATYRHLNDGALCEACGCSGNLVPRSRLEQENPQPMVHFGLIASGDRIMQSGTDRDTIARREEVIGYEMEGSGVLDIFPCVVIKGACNYADSHKAKEWQQYAAATAAACMKAFLRQWTPSPSVQDDGARSAFLVPYPQISSFVGRSEILQKLYQLPLNSTSQTRVAFCGLDGIGYPDLSVFWIHASNNERFREAYSDIAQKFKIPGHENPEEDVLALVKRWLESSTCGHWLMAIDNADDPELFFNKTGGLGRYLPECAHGTMLITTRNLQVASRLTKEMATFTIEIGEMNEDETAQLLSTQLNEGDTIITITDYIQLLDKSDQNLVDLLSEDFMTAERDSDTPRAVAEACIVSFEQIRRLDTLADELLSIMSLLDCQAIPHEFLSTYAQDQGHGELQLTKALGVLKAFSFVIEDKDHNFDMHRLVHLVTRRWLGQQNKTQCYAELAISVVSERFPYGGYENWKICNAYLPHASAVLNLKEETASSEAKLARSELLHNVGCFARGQGQFQQAEQRQKEALELRQDLLGEEHPPTLDTTYELADIYIHQGRWNEAELLHAKVLDIRKRVLGTEHPNTLASMNNPALTYSNQGRWKEAELLHIQALEIGKRKVLGPDHPVTITTHEELASIYWKQSQFSEAEIVEVEILEQRRKILGEEHPDTLLCMHNLAVTWRDMDRFEEAIVLMQDCLHLGQTVVTSERGW